MLFYENKNGKKNITIRELHNWNGWTGLFLFLCGLKWLHFDQVQISCQKPKKWYTSTNSMGILVLTKVYYIEGVSKSGVSKKGTST